MIFTRMLILGALTVIFTQARTIEVPDWVNHVACILEGVQGIEQMLIDDGRLYANWTKSLEGMCVDFERRDAERAKLFKVVREKVSLLQSQLALCEADKASKLEENEATIHELQASIVSIRQEMQEEVGRLNALVDILNQQIQEAREAYAELVSLDGQKAAALITELIAIKQAYSGMIEEREMFIATLDRFVNRARVFLVKSGNEMDQLGIELVGPSYTESEPITDVPACSPEESDEDVMSE